MKFALFSLILSCTGLPGAMAQEPPRPPNVLLVLLDDLGYSDLGCYGGEIPTPNIDALGKGGLRFTHMANSARCSPTRASLLSGLHPAQAGIPNFSGQLAPNSATLAEILRSAGYHTSMVGKWHLGNTPATLPTARGFDEFYGYTNGHSAGMWNPANYRRLPADHPPELSHTPGKYYATDVFTDYALEFIRQGGKSGKPWFLYLAHSAPHFPIQAPAASAAPLLPVYRRGWDILREERFSRLKRIGLADHEGWKLSPLSLVPVEKNPDIANGYSGLANPQWSSLDEIRREDLARRMAIYAAMVKHVDDGIGRIVSSLKAAGTFENTLILFLSDNGACYEWGPFGFDGQSRSGKTTVHEGPGLDAMGGPGTYMSYGSAWANLSNTPFRLYKHFTHEGGTITPFIVHWPAGVTGPDRWVRDRAYITDIMPTVVEATRANYPTSRDGNPVPPAEGLSLIPLFQAKQPLAPRAIYIQHEGARSIQKGQWKLVKGKRFPSEANWELYDIQADPVELNDLAAARPDLVASLADEWLAWAGRTGTPVDGKLPKQRDGAAGD